MVKHTLPLGTRPRQPREQYAAAAERRWASRGVVLRQLDLDGRADRRARQDLGAVTVRDGSFGENGALELRCRRHAAERVKVSDHLIAQLGDAR